MKVVIPAAGQGTRLRPHTDSIPKCMVEVAGRPMLMRTLDTLNKAGLHDISVVTGYKQERIPGRGIKKYTNPNYETTNMVYSIFCAEQEFDDDLIICYGDILFTQDVIQKLIDSPAPLSVIVDRDWQRQWEMRMEDPLNDAETMKINAEGNITELGKKPKALTEIEGQYIGLVKISKEALPEVRRFYHGLDKKALYNGQPFEKMYVTDFVQLIIDNLMPAKAVWINGGWFEVDTVSDLELINERYNDIIA